jgi:hypothetical protein
MAIHALRLVDCVSADGQCSKHLNCENFRRPSDPFPDTNSSGVAIGCVTMSFELYAYAYLVGLKYQKLWQSETSSMLPRELSALSICALVL